MPKLLKEVKTINTIAHVGMDEGRGAGAGGDEHFAVGQKRVVG